MSDIDAFRQNTGTPVVRTQPPEGVAGWLIWPMLGLIVSPVIAALHLMGGLAIAPTLPGLLPGEATALVIYFIALIVLGVIAPVALLVMLFRELRIFPGYYVWFRLIDPVIHLAGLVVVLRYLPNLTSVTLREAGIVVIASVAGSAIWIPYMRSSHRVKNTFVN